MIKRILSNWQELIQLPLIFILCWSAFKIIPKIDGEAGVDGIGYISGLLAASAIMLAIFFWAWFYRHTYSTQSEEERKSNTDWIRINRPTFFYISEKLHQLVVVLIVIYCIKK